MSREPLTKAEFSGSCGLSVRCVCMTQTRLSSTDFGIADAASPSDLIGASLGKQETQGPLPQRRRRAGDRDTGHPARPEKRLPDQPTGRQRARRHRKAARRKSPGRLPELPRRRKVAHYGCSSASVRPRPNSVYENYFRKAALGVVLYIDDKKRAAPCVAHFRANKKAAQRL